MGGEPSHRKPVPLDGSAWHEGAGWEHGDVLFLQPPGHVQFRALACGQGFQARGFRQDGGDPGHDGGGRQVHDHGEQVVEESRFGHREPEVASGPDCGLHSGGGTAGELFLGEEVGHRPIMPRPGTGGMPDRALCCRSVAGRGTAHHREAVRIRRRELRRRSDG